MTGCWSAFLKLCVFNAAPPWSQIHSQTHSVEGTRPLVAHRHSWRSFSDTFSATPPNSMDSASVVCYKDTDVLDALFIHVQLQLLCGWHWDELGEGTYIKYWEKGGCLQTLDHWVQVYNQVNSNSMYYGHRQEMSLERNQLGGCGAHHRISLFYLVHGSGILSSLRFVPNW